MKQSKLFAKTLKNLPKDAVTISHQLLLRADFIDQLAAGVYTLLPLGFRVHKKIENIIREEMNSLGAQEFIMPTLIPKSLWTETGRWKTIDPPLFVVKDRHGKELGLGPTHEEVITDLIRRRINSYKDLPFSLYQIQNKFRNEMRATGGLLRVREFVMKDLYSFHTDAKDLAAFYKKVTQAYKNIYQRCGVESVMVEASSGSIGGNECHEFMVIADSGEDNILVCRECGWAGNVEVFDKQKDCPECKTNLETKKGIEAGHIFKLDDIYSHKMKANFVDQKGKAKPIMMGCYGIGVGRLMATVVESSNDKTGIIWPTSIAPFQVHLVSLKENLKADKIYQQLTKAGVEVLYDDRDISAGAKFAEADLIGIPYRLVVSQKTQNKIEFKPRGEKKAELLSLEQVLKKL
ncbi:MAG: proline--tRNA ligase [Parcubacteria group bacterium]|nr:proline--tRNA ligase [Parcubacteria group bacterium]|tara:strand:- start:14972 stop:16186 length:1215 start_codon:yes stop_codon:yes gene_type:complete